MCTKKLVFHVEDLKAHKIIEDLRDIQGLIFMGKVQGTKPDFEDCFKIYIELRDVEGNIIKVIKFNPKAELSVCRIDGTPTPIMIEISFKESDPLI